MAVTDDCQYSLQSRGDIAVTHFARRRTLYDGIGAAGATVPSQSLWVTLLTRPGNTHAAGTIRKMDGL